MRTGERGRRTCSGLSLTGAFALSVSCACDFSPSPRLRRTSLAAARFGRWRLRAATACVAAFPGALRGAASGHLHEACACCRESSRLPSSLVRNSSCCASVARGVVCGGAADGRLGVRRLSIGSLIHVVSSSRLWNITGEFPPTEIAVARQAQHRRVFDRVAVGVDLGKVFESISFLDAPELFRAHAITAPIPAGQHTIDDFQLGANHVERREPAPFSEVHVEGRGHDNHRVSLSLVPRDSLFGLRPDCSRQGAASVVPSELRDLRLGSPTKHERRKFRPGRAGRNNPPGSALIRAAVGMDAFTDSLMNGANESLNVMVPSKSNRARFMSRRSYLQAEISARTPFRVFSGGHPNRGDSRVLRFSPVVLLASSLRCPCVEGDGDHEELSQRGTSETDGCPARAARSVPPAVRRRQV
jgi:hypothetical protein